MIRMSVPVAVRGDDDKPPADLRQDRGLTFCDSLYHLAQADIFTNDRYRPTIVPNLFVCSMAARTHSPYSSISMLGRTVSAETGR
jgi:hypothetical protein